MSTAEVAPVALVESRIMVIRGPKSLTRLGFGKLYQAETKALNRAVRRNQDRFPEDFMFQLTREEVESLSCQFGTSNESRGGRRYSPYSLHRTGDSHAFQRAQ